MYALLTWPGYRRAIPQEKRKSMRNSSPNLAPFQLRHNELRFLAYCSAFLAVMRTGNLVKMTVYVRHHEKKCVLFCAC